MCGRYTYTDPARVAEAMLRDLGVEMTSEIPRYNVAPGQVVPIIRAAESGKLVAEPMRWGLIPWWDEAEKPRIAPINARSEEAFGKPMFRQAVQRRRALFPCDGFFEWQAAESGPKAPFLIRLQGGEPFTIAGIYESATQLRPVPTCALFTTAPNELMAPIHRRMPVILDPDSALRWLNPEPMTREEFANLCQPYPAPRMSAERISTLVNNVRNDTPEVLRPTSGWAGGG
jgi:putative SOS response-associated peptidase YedK